MYIRRTAQSPGGLNAPYPTRHAHELMYRIATVGRAPLAALQTVTYHARHTTGTGAFAMSPSVLYPVLPYRGSLSVREVGPTEPPPPRLLKRVRAAARLRHYSRRTEEAYVA